MSFGPSDGTYPGPGPHVARSHSDTQVPRVRSAAERNRVRHLSCSRYGIFLLLWRYAIVMPAKLIARPVLPGGPSRALLRKVQRSVDQHGGALVSTRAELLRDNGTAHPHSTQWNDEVARFINSQIAEVLNRRERATVGRHFEAIQDHVARRVGEIAARQWVYQ
jgi:hypothetical protein